MIRDHLKEIAEAYKPELFWREEAIKCGQMVPFVRFRYISKTDFLRQQNGGNGSIPFIREVVEMQYFMNAPKGCDAKTLIDQSHEEIELLDSIRSYIEKTLFSHYGVKSKLGKFHCYVRPVGEGNGSTITYYPYAVQSSACMYVQVVSRFVVEYRKGCDPCCNLFFDDAKLVNKKVKSTWRTIGSSTGT